MFNKVRILKENSTYRLSDLVYQPYRGQHIGWSKRRGEILNNEKFSNTILQDYLKNKKHEEDFATLKKIVSHHTLKNGYNTPQTDELVFHIRLGDVCRKDHDGHGKYLIRLRESYCNKLYQKININYKKIKKITYVTALNYAGYKCTVNGMNHDFTFSMESVNDSLKILEDIERQTNELGYELNIVSSVNADEDICYMANAKYFVESASRFSRLISQILPDDAVRFGKP